MKKVDKSNLLWNWVCLPRWSDLTHTVIKIRKLGRYFAFGFKNMTEN